MIVVDSSGWLEYFAKGDNSHIFAEQIISNPDMVIPTIIYYELWKKISRERGEKTAINIMAQLQRYEIIPLDETLSILAANISNTFKLAMADSIIYATAQKYNAVLWTQDSDFKDLDNVEYVEKKR
ncbi:MAG: type II toxin-antitoxin system VapC family toxin [bacterium]|nr:type II toxin-antitoxin system VapC family toxin [bacterium]